MKTQEEPTRQHSEKCPKLYGSECTCDGYHTLEELYAHRAALFIKLCRIVVSEFEAYRHRYVWRSRLHADGSCYEGWFVMGIHKEPGKQITYHLPLSQWEDTDFAETLERAPEYDGHTSDDVLARLKRVSL